MLIIGEKLNSSVPSAKELMEKKDAAGILELARAQKENGAEYIDINAGMFLEQEARVLAFLAGTLAKEGFALSVDSPSCQAAEAALKAAGGRGHLINSVTLEKARLEGMTSLAVEYGCRIIALCMQPPGTPETVQSRLDTAGRLVEHLTKAGVREQDILIDPMLRPLGADENSGLDAMETIAHMKKNYPGCPVVCGLSNLSFGLPKRRIINRAFAVMAIASGLDAAILDPLDRDLMGLVAAAEAIAGRDEYCLEYIGKCRSGEIG